MTIDDVMQWLKSLGVPAGAVFTMARLNTDEEHRIGVYQRPQSNGMQVAIGNATKTRTKYVQLLIRWTLNARETELAAQALYDAIRAADHPTIGTSTVSYIDLVTPEPVDVGADENNGIFERAVWLDIYY